MYVKVGDAAPQLFASAASGSQAAPWIGARQVYEFRLYSAKDQRELLASVKVERK